MIATMHQLPAAGLPPRQRIATNRDHQANFSVSLPLSLVAFAARDAVESVKRFSESAGVRSFRQWTPEFRGRSGLKVHCAAVCESNNSRARHAGGAASEHAARFRRMGCRTVGDQRALLRRKVRSWSIRAVNPDDGEEPATMK